MFPFQSVHHTAYKRLADQKRAHARPPFLPPPLVISICITKTWTPSSPLYLNIIPYVVGGLASFALCAIAMGTEERWAKENGKWGKVYPRVVAVVAWGMELVILVLFVIALRDGESLWVTHESFARVVVQLRAIADDYLPTDPSTRPSITPLPSIHLAVLSLRLLLLTSFLLSQTPLFYSSIYLPAGASSTEETSLLGRENGTTSSTTYGTTKPPPSKPHPLRSSKAPSNRPPDPKSLSILTLFSRVYTLFPYLWPSKSFSLQILALICIGLMLFRRALNVFVPILFGNIISDLSAGRREFFLFFPGLSLFLLGPKADFATLSQRPTPMSSSTLSHPSPEIPTRCSTAIFGYQSNNTVKGR